MFIFFVVLKDYPHASLYKDSHDRNPLIGGIASPRRNGIGPGKRL